jgi:hypothetical protein
MGMLSARLAVRHMSRYTASLPNPEPTNRLLATGIDHGVYLLAPAPAGDFFVLRAEPAAGPE